MSPKNNLILKKIPHENLLLTTLRINFKASVFIELESRFYAYSEEKEEFAISILKQNLPFLNAQYIHTNIIEPPPNIEK